MTENLIHIKLEYKEALESKKDVLSSEMGLLRVASAIKNHRLLRSEEMKIKLKFLKKIKELKTNLGKLQQVLPKLKIPEIIQEGRNISEESSILKKDFHDKDIEVQLKEIQDRLRNLE